MLHLSSFIFHMSASLLSLTTSISREARACCLAASRAMDALIPHAEAEALLVARGSLVPLHRGAVVTVVEARALDDARVGPHVLLGAALEGAARGELGARAVFPGQSSSVLLA